MSSNEILDLLEYFNRQILENIFLNKENKDDKKIKILVDECIRLNKVINEAIEYIESLKQKEDYGNGISLDSYELTTDETKSLLYLLKGEDK